MSQILLSAKNITRRFGGLVAIDNVSVDLKQGSVHSVIGTNGVVEMILAAVIVPILAKALKPAAVRMGVTDGAEQ